MKMEHCLVMVLDNISSLPPILRSHNVNNDITVLPAFGLSLVPFCIFLNLSQKLTSYHGVVDFLNSDWSEGAHYFHVLIGYRFYSNCSFRDFHSRHAT